MCVYIYTHTHTHTHTHTYSISKKYFLLFCLEISVMDLERDKQVMIWILNQCCFLKKYELLLSPNQIIDGLPWWLNGKESTCQCRRRGFYPWVGKIPWRRKWLPTRVFLPGKSHGQRSLPGLSPWVAMSWTQLRDWTITTVMLITWKWVENSYFSLFTWWMISDLYFRLISLPWSYIVSHL